MYGGHHCCEWDREVLIGVYRRFRLLIRTVVGFLPNLSDLVRWYLSFTSGTELSIQRRLYFVDRDLTYRSSVEGIVVGAFAGRVSEFFSRSLGGCLYSDSGPVSRLGQCYLLYAPVGNTDTCKISEVLGPYENVLRSKAIFTTISRGESRASAGHRHDARYHLFFLLVGV